MTARKTTPTPADDTAPAPMKAAGAGGEALTYRGEASAYAGHVNDLVSTVREALTQLGVDYAAVMNLAPGPDDTQAHHHLWRAQSALADLARAVDAVSACAAELGAATI